MGDFIVVCAILICSTAHEASNLFDDFVAAGRLLKVKKISVNGRLTSLLCNVCTFVKI